MKNQVRIVDDDIPLAQFAVAFNGASWTDPDSIALMVMQSMLGSWNKSAGGGKHMGFVIFFLSSFYILWAKYVHDSRFISFGPVI